MPLIDLGPAPSKKKGGLIDLGPAPVKKGGLIDLGPAPLAAEDPNKPASVAADIGAKVGDGITSRPLSEEEGQIEKSLGQKHQAANEYIKMTPAQRFLKDKGYPAEFEALMKEAPGIDLNAGNKFGLTAGIPRMRKRGPQETFDYNYQALKADDPLRQQVDRFHAFQKAYTDNLAKTDGRRKFKGFWDELGRSVASGSLNVASGLTGTLASASEGAIWDKEKLEAAAESLHKMAQSKELAPAAAEGKWNKTKQFTANAIGQALPYMAASTAATIATGTPLAAFGVGFAVEGDNEYRDILAAGGSEEEARMGRLIVGTINGAIESLQVSNVIKIAKGGKEGVRAIASAAKKRAWSEVRRIGKDLTQKQLEHVLREALEEAMQETASIAGVEIAEPGTISGKEALTRIGGSALGGGVAAFGIGGAGAMASGLRSDTTEHKGIEDELTAAIQKKHGVSEAEARAIARDAINKEFYSGEGQDQGQDEGQDLTEIFGPPGTELGMKKPQIDVTEINEDIRRANAEGRRAREREKRESADAIDQEIAQLDAEVEEIQRAAIEQGKAKTAREAEKQKIAEGLEAFGRSPEEARAAAEREMGRREAPEKATPIAQEGETQEVPTQTTRQTDLLGRPILQGGASGKQQEFLDKEQFKTEQERQRIVAERDDQGQQTFTTEAQIEESGTAKVEPGSRAAAAVTIEPKKGTATVDIEEQTEEEYTGISRKLRNRLIREAESDIAASDVYKDSVESNEYKTAQIGPGYYYVGGYEGEVEAIIGKRKGFPTRLQKQFTFTDKSAKHWDEAVREATMKSAGGVTEQNMWTEEEMDISEFVERVKEAVEGQGKKGKLSRAALDSVAESGDPYIEYKARKLEMLREGATAAEIDEMTAAWAEGYGIDIDSLTDEWIGPEPMKLRQIKEIDDEAEQEKQLDILARDLALKEQRAEAAAAVNDVLAANEVEVEVEEVADIDEDALPAKPDDDVPFERRGRATGAAVITPAGREIVYLAYGADAETGYHEGYHILRRRLTARDIGILDKHFESEEAEAAAFGRFMAGEKAPTTMIRHIWTKIKKLLAKIRSALEGRGYRTVDDIFGEIGAGTITLEGGPVRGFGAKYERRPVFYSKLQRAVEEKMPGKMERGQFRAWAKKAGIKEEELRWLGVEELLNKKPKVTKAEVLETIAANNLQIEEVEKGRGKDPNIENWERWARNEYPNAKTIEVKDVSPSTSQRRYDVYVDGERVLEQGGGQFTPGLDKTKFSQYTLPGGENYRELLLKFPSGQKFNRKLEDEFEKKLIAAGAGTSQINELQINWGSPKAQMIVESLGPEARQAKEEYDRKYEQYVQNPYKSGHWDESNVLAHVRFNDRTDADGKKVLFIEEIQSDWHQEGRKRGYGKTALTSVQQERLVYLEGREMTEPGLDEAGQHELEILRDVRDGRMAAGKNPVPDAPFKKTWHELAVKRMLRYAAENGYDKVAWTTGEQQAERYDLSKQVDAIEFKKRKDDMVNLEVRKDVWHQEENYRDEEDITRQLGIPEWIPLKDVEKWVGKDIAKKIVDAETPISPESGNVVGRLAGLDLAVGGTGMKGFYDKILPAFIKKYAKRWGAKVGETKITTETSNVYGAYTDFNIVNAGTDKYPSYEVKGKVKTSGLWASIARYESRVLAEEFVRKITAEKTPVHAVDITPSMRKSVMGGQVMFETSGERLRREAINNARVKAKKERLRSMAGLKKKKVSRARIKISIQDILNTPPLDKEWIEKAELPPGKVVSFEPVSRRSPPVPNQAVPEEIYDRNRQRSAVKEKLKDLGAVGKSAKDSVGELVHSASYILGKIAPELRRQIREHARVVNTRTQRHLSLLEPFVKAVRKMKKADQRDLDLALKNGDIERIEQIITKYDRKLKTQEAYEAARDVDEALFEGGNAVGMEIDHRQHHWHRRVKDANGLLKELVSRFGRSRIMPVYQAALERRKQQAGGRELTADEKAQVLNSMMRGFGQRIWLAKPGGAKERSLWLVDSEIDKYYYSAIDSMLIYVREMNRAIADREFFGKQTKRINKLRAQRSRLATRLYKLGTRIGYNKPMMEDKWEGHISKARKLFEKVTEDLEAMQGIDLSDTIGGYILDLVVDGHIEAEQQDKVERALKAYFNYKPTGKAVRAFKGVSYLTTIGSPFATLTQLKDYARILYRSPGRTLTETMKMLIPGVKQEYSMKDLWLSDIAVDISGMSRILDGTLTTTQFKLLDRKMKELYINVVLGKYRKQAKKARHLKSGSTFRERIEYAMGKDTEQTIRDLRSGRKTELTDRLAWSELLDLHPIALSEMTVAYLRGGGGTRMLYTLRTFGLKQFEYARREIFDSMKKHPARALGRLIWLAFTLALAGAGVETIKDLIRGREPDIPGEIIDEWLSLIFMSRFTAGVVRREGLGRGAVRTLAPPTNIIDYPVTDIMQGKVKRTPRLIPVVGEPYYWLGGHGRELTDKKRGKKSGAFD